MGSFTTPLRVGIVVLLALSAFGVGLTLIGGKGFGGGTYLVSTVFDDATGLGARSRVQIAGIVIGQVDHIELDPATAQARVFLAVKKKFTLYGNASVTKRSESILGDYLIDVYPGTPDQPALSDGGEIRIVVKQPGINEIFKSLNKISGDISDVTGNLRKVLGSDEGEQNLRQIVAGLASVIRQLDSKIGVITDRLDATLENFQQMSGDLKRLTRAQAENLGAIVENTRDATAEARDALRTIREVIGSPQGGDVKQSVVSLRSGLDRLDKSLANVQEISQKINDGKGTVGKLINDDQLIKNLDKAAGDIGQLLGRANDTRIDISTRHELMLGVVNPNSSFLQVGADTAYNPWTKNYFNIKIAPRPDKWYGIELVDDPRGNVRRLVYANTVRVNGQPVLNDFYPPSVTQITTERVLKFSAFIAKRYGPFSARFGILENTGGFGIKGHFLHDDLTLSADVFEFANPLKERPRLKLYADYRFLKYLMITIGADDLANRVITDEEQKSRIISGRDFFFGGGIIFNDDDLKVLLGLLPLGALR